MKYHMKKFQAYKVLRSMCSLGHSKTLSFQNNLVHFFSRKFLPNQLDWSYHLILFSLGGVTILPEELRWATISSLSI
jgi:superfamily I DNA and RNA helicase